MEKWLDIKLKVKVPNNTTTEDIKKWALYHLGLTGDLMAENSLIDRDFQPVGGWVVVDDSDKAI